jgi:hypothetical protein
MKNLMVPFCLLLVISCSQSDSSTEAEIAATVGDKVLLIKDIPMVLHPDITEQDSISITRKYIQNWIRKELLLKKAEENLTENMLSDIEKQLQDTKASLMIFNYEQNMIRQRMDTVITEAEIEAYYNQYQERFELRKNIVKALYIKVPSSAPNLEDVRRWYRSDSDEDLNELESYCYQFANKYDDFQEKWVYFEDLYSKFPMEINDEERFLRGNTTMETSDSLFQYFVKIRDYRLKTTIAPLEFIHEQIRDIIFNERKITFVKELENSLYDDARSRNEFKIY